MVWREMGCWWKMDCLNRQDKAPRHRLWQYSCAVTIPVTDAIVFDSPNRNKELESMKSDSFSVDGGWYSCKRYLRPKVENYPVQEFYGSRFCSWKEKCAERLLEWRSCYGIKEWNRRPQHRKSILARRLKFELVFLKPVDQRDRSNLEFKKQFLDDILPPNSAIEGVEIYEDFEAECNDYLHARVTTSEQNKRLQGLFGRCRSLILILQWNRVSSIHYAITIPSRWMGQLWPHERGGTQ